MIPLQSEQVTDDTPRIVTAAMSFIIPGTGQIYNGRFLVGAIWMFIAIYVWFTIGSPGLICHICSAYTAYRFSGTDRL